MRQESEDLFCALLKHHKANKISPDVKDFDFDSGLITYGQLCKQAGLPSLTHIVGTFLGEIATYCKEKWMASDQCPCCQLIFQNARGGF